MKYKVKMTHTVELFVEAKSEEEVLDWMYSRTPDQVKEMTPNCTEDYEDEIVCSVSDNSVVDYIITKN